MNRRLQQADYFLKIWRDIAKENPNLNFLANSDMVYSQLTRLNVPLKERNISLDNSLFPGWVNRFQYTPNIKCEVRDDWPYFCLFINENQTQKRVCKNLYTIR